MTQTQEETLDLAPLDEILDKYRDQRGAVIPILQQAQEVFGYLPREVLETISRKMSIPLSDLYGVATFYSQFYLTRRGKHIIRCCDGTACHVRGAAKIIETLEEELGISAGDIGFTISALTDGAFVDEFLLNDDKIDIYLYGRRGTAATLDELGQLPVYTPTGTVIPLSTVTDIVETVDTSSIRRVDGRRMVTLSIIPPDDVALETAVQTVRDQVVDHLRASGRVPASVGMEISGASDQLDATREALRGNYLVAIVIIYLLLVAIFTHWGYPLLIMTTIPLGVAGGIVGLWLLNWFGAQLPLVGLSALSQPFDMIAMLGFLILMGTVVNNPILIVHQAMGNVRDRGMSARAAVRDAVETRLRPIAMSTLTTVCGLAPLVFLPGAGTELYRGVGAIVLFGVLGTAVVSLTFLPALSVMVMGLRQRRQPPVAVATAASGSDDAATRPVDRTGTE